MVAEGAAGEFGCIEYLMDEFLSNSAEAPEVISEGPKVTSAAAEGPPPASPSPARSHQDGEHWLSVVQWLSSTIIIAVFVITFVTQAFQIPSESMENTLLVGDYLLVDKVHFASPGFWGKVLPYEPIGRGDIVVFRYPVHPALHFVKRVIGLPGDHVHLSGGRVFVNGKPLDDSSYVVHKAGHYDSYRDDFPRGNYISMDVNSSWWGEMRQLVQDGELIVPADHYFVLGDNRDRSLDSRYWGFVPRENIIGRPLVIYWSMKQPESAFFVVTDGKLSRLAYTLTHLLENARWNRSMRVIH
jgi:signal peptidase I